MYVINSHPRRVQAATRLTGKHSDDKHNDNKQQNN
jgi:hypothetical protein